jgi:peptidyl-prolyl cis-trans isomerase C/peptidyl-prolyl cis-trans isomerase D
MRKTVIVGLSLAVASVIAITAKAATELARINNTVLTLEDFNNKYAENLKFFRYKSPTKKNVLDDMIKRDLGIQEARKAGLDKDPEVLDRINTVLYHSLLDKKLASKFDAISITNDEIEEYYKSNPEIRTSHIFVQVRFDATPAQEKAARQKIQQIQQKLNEALKSGKQTFAEVARAYSEGVAAPAGGDIDYQTKDKLDPVYYQTAVGLKKVGNISGIVRSQFGYHVIKLTGIKEYKDVDHGQYKRIIFDEKRTKIFEAYMDELKKKANIKVNYSLLGTETDVHEQAPHKEN